MPADARREIGDGTSDPGLAGVILRVGGDRVALCIVHGGGDEDNRHAERSGKRVSFVGGRRMTSAADLELLRMVLSGVVKRTRNSLVTEEFPRRNRERTAADGAEVIDAATLGLPDGRHAYRPNSHAVKPASCHLSQPVSYDVSSGPRRDSQRQLRRCGGRVAVPWARTSWFVPTWGESGRQRMVRSRIHKILRASSCSGFAALEWRQSGFGTGLQSRGRRVRSAT